MKKAALLTMCLLTSCGKRIEHHYDQKPASTPETPQLQVTCDDIFMQSYFDLQMKSHLAQVEYNKWAKYDSVSDLVIGDLTNYNKQLNHSYDVFESFKTISSCTGLVKNKVTTINTMEVLNQAKELIIKIEKMIKEAK